MPRVIRRSSSIACVALKLCAAVPASGAIFDRDDRQYVSPELGTPFGAIGLVVGGRPFARRFTTGTLIDECHVLTAQHIFTSSVSSIGKKLTFVGGLGTRNQVSSGGEVEVAGGLERYSRPDQAYDARGHDWLLIRLKRCLGKQFGFATLRVKASEAGELDHVQSAGYPLDRDRRRGLSVDPACRISGIYELVWLDDCSALYGDSGGPIFRLNPDTHQLEIYAITSAAYCWPSAVPFSGNYANQSTPVWMFANDIKVALSAAKHSRTPTSVDSSTALYRGQR